MVIKRDKGKSQFEIFIDNEGVKGTRSWVRLDQTERNQTVLKRMVSVVKGSTKV